MFQAADTVQWFQYMRAYQECNVVCFWLWVCVCVQLVGVQVAVDINSMRLQVACRHALLHSSLCCSADVMLLVLYTTGPLFFLYFYAPGGPCANSGCSLRVLTPPSCVYAVAIVFMPNLQLEVACAKPGTTCPVRSFAMQCAMCRHGSIACR